MKPEDQALIINKLYIGTFSTAIGKKCIDHLEKVFVDRPIYKKGESIEDAAYRQGQADLVKQIRQQLKGIEDGR